jgi:SAM-dependent methyltransferase
VPPANANLDGERRSSFDAAAELYACGRPGYPNELLEHLFSLADIGPDSRVLEIGPGTGQLSVAIATRAASLLAIELGSSLAAVLRRNLAPSANTEIVVANFDDWTGTSGLFDAVVAATSFHWLNPSTRLAKCASLLRSGGALAVVETRWGVAVGHDPFFAASQTCYARWTPNHDPNRRQLRPDDVEPISLNASHPELVVAARRRYLVQRTYTSTEYADLLSTFSDVLTLTPANRQLFLAAIATLIDSRFDGQLTRHDLYDLSVARRI